jgi:hypothetical protein
MLLVQAYYLTAAPHYPSRTAAGRIMPKNEVLSSLDAVLLSTITLLDEVTRAPRRPVAPASPQTPPP